MGQGASSSSEEDDAYIPVDQRKWEIIHGIDKVMDECYPVSRQMTHVQRHSPELRELDGAVGLEKLLSHSKRFPGQMDNWDGLIA